MRSALVLAFLALSACLTREKFPEAYAEAACGYLLTCGDPESFGGSNEACEQDLLGKWDAEFAPTIQWDAAEASECIDLIESATQPCSDGGYMNDACRRVLGWP